MSANGPAGAAGLERAHLRGLHVLVGGEGAAEPRVVADVQEDLRPGQEVDHLLAEDVLVADRDPEGHAGGLVIEAVAAQELLRLHPLCGIAVATVDGAVYSVGDCDAMFTIQSVSKPFLYAAMLETLGRERMLAKVGVEPTGEAFNSIVLDETHNRPFNPMVNAGAIAVADLVEGPAFSDAR